MNGSFNFYSSFQEKHLQFIYQHWVYVSYIKIYMSISRLLVKIDIFEIRIFEENECEYIFISWIKISVSDRWEIYNENKYIDFCNFPCEIWNTLKWHVP